MSIRIRKSIKPTTFFPRSFLFFFPLHLGAELITAMGLLNKASGFYGILSIFTGHPLSVMEWILNVFSLILLPVYCAAFLTVTHRNALQMVLFAYLYTIDTVVCSIGIGIYNIVHWFTSKAHEMAKNGQEQGDIAATASGVAEKAMSTVQSVASSTINTINTGIPTITSAAAAASTASLSQRDDGDSNNNDPKVINKSASLAQETSISIVITVAFMLVRVYFTLCLLSYARQLVRQQSLRPHNGSPKGSTRARIQQIALSFCESFWTGYDTKRVSSGSSIASLSTSSDSSRVSSQLSERNNKEYDSEVKNGGDDVNDMTARLNQDF